MPIKVFCADRDPIISIGMNAIVERLARVRLVGRSTDCRSVLQVAEQDGFDVLVTDSQLKIGAGLSDYLISVFRRRYPNKGLVIHSTNRNPAYVATLCAHGCNALVDREDIIEHIESGVLAAFRGARYISPHLAQRETGDDVRLTRHLSGLELHVLRLFLSGRTINEIADSCFRAKQTISTHKASGMSKLGVSRDAHLFKVCSEDDIGLLLALAIEKGQLHCRAGVDSCESSRKYGRLSSS